MSVYYEVEMQVMQRLFEMSPLRTDIGSKSWTPLVDRVVDDALLQSPDCPTRQSNAVSDRQRLAPSPDNHGPASYRTLLLNGLALSCLAMSCHDVSRFQRPQTNKEINRSITITRPPTGGGVTKKERNRAKTIPLAGTG